MLTDLRHLWRSLRRSRASAAAAALTLSLTLGAGTSIFAVADAVLLTPPPFSRPHELYTVGEVPLSDQAAPRAGVPYATVEAWRGRARSLAALEAFDGTNLTLTGLGPAERVQATDATPGLLPLLGVSPTLGRTFDADDVGQPVAIVSHAFWRSKLNADPGVVGRAIVLGGLPHTVLGVLPEPFVFALGVADIWRPLVMAPIQAARDGLRVRVIARLSEHTTPAQLAAALESVSRASTPPARVLTTSVSTVIAGDRTTTLALLSGAVGLAIVIAFVNLAGLLIVRSVDRRRELAIRAALGARPATLAWQVLLESGAIVAMGTIGGLWLGWWGTPTVADLVLERAPGQPTIALTVSWRVMGGLTLVSCLCAVLCSVWPARAATRGRAGSGLRHGATSTVGERALRRAFVVGEVALACVLVASMALVSKAFFALLGVAPGFEARGVLALQVSLPRASYPGSPQAVAFYAVLQSALTERLGARTVAVIDELPLTGSGRRRLLGVRPDDRGHEAVIRSAGPAYFDVMGMPVVAGRGFDATDAGAGVPPRVVISASLADHLFASTPPVGRQIWLLPQRVAAEVIGVVGDVPHRALDDAATPTLYESSRQEPSHSSIIVVRSSRPAADVTALVREEVGRLDAALPVYRIRSMEDIVAASPGLPARRLLASTFTGFALLALALSGVGLFGVMAHDVAARRPELGLRLALGESPARLVRRTLGQGIWLVATGLTVGSVLSVWAADLLGGLVSGAADPVDVTNIGAAIVALTLVGAAAVFPAARRAARADPLAVLRGD